MKTIKTILGFLCLAGVAYSATRFPDGDYVIIAFLLVATGVFLLRD